MHSTNQSTNHNVNTNNMNASHSTGYRYTNRYSEMQQADEIAMREYSPRHLERPIASIKMTDLPKVDNVAIAYASSTARHMKSMAGAITRIPKPAQVIMSFLAAASLAVPLLGTIPAQAAETSTMAGKATDTVARELTDNVVKPAKDGMDGYMTDLTAHRNQADGRADAIAEAYSGYIDDASVEELHTYESYAKTAPNNAEADEWVGKINEKESEAKGAKEAAEKKAADEAAAKAKQEAEAKAKSTSSESDASTSGGFMTVAQFKYKGAMNWNGHRWTYYSETVLPGSGLRIPGRHVSNGAVCDSDGYVVLASCDYAKGTVIDTPIGKGKVYDVCPTSGTIDLYVH